MSKTTGHLVTTISTLQLTNPIFVGAALRADDQRFNAIHTRFVDSGDQRICAMPAPT